MTSGLQEGREGRAGYGVGRLQTASQQLPVPGEPPRAVQRSALDLVRHFVTTGHVDASTHAVVPSWQSPVVHVPGKAKQHVTKPAFLPQVERDAQRTTAPLQLVGSPLATACLT